MKQQNLPLRLLVDKKPVVERKIIVDQHLTVGYEWHYYRAKDDSAELRLVRADGLKRAFNFRKGSKIQIGMMMVMFTNEDMVQEVTVDEDERAGRVPRSKLKFD